MRELVFTIWIRFLSYKFCCKSTKVLRYYVATKALYNVRLDSDFLAMTQRKVPVFPIGLLAFREKSKPYFIYRDQRNTASGL